MVSDVKDKAEKLRATTQHTDCWTDHSFMGQSFILNKKRVWNFKVETKDLVNGVRAQSDTVSILSLLFSGIESSIID